MPGDEPLNGYRRTRITAALGFTVALIIMLIHGQVFGVEPSTPLVVTIAGFIALLLGIEGLSRLRSNGK